MIDNISLPLIITKREVTDTISDWRVVVPTFVLAILFPAIMVLGIKWGTPFMVQVDPDAAVVKAALFGAMMSAFFPTSFSLVIALESFVGEKERNTIETLLTTPLSNGQLFIGKFLAVMTLPVLLSSVALFIYLLGIWWLLNITVPLSFIILTMMLTFSEVLIMVAGAVIVSSQTATIKAANLLASFIIIPMALSVQGQVLLILTGYGYILWFMVAGFLGIAAILVRMGVTVFDREAVLTRENDDLHITSIAEKLARLWRRLPNNAFAGDEVPSTGIHLVRLFRADIPQIIGLAKIPILVAVGVLVSSAIMGFLFAMEHPIPMGELRVSEIVNERTSLALGVLIEPKSIFVHNIRTITIAAILSIFTFGLAGLMVIVLTFGLVGFVLGEAMVAGIAPMPFIVGFLLPHGVLEVPAMILASALSLRVGMSIMSPPSGVGYVENLLFSLVNWVKGAALFVPIFLAAAIIEARLTPQIALWIFGKL
ncbi:MAG: hypothetical protein EXR50_05375 [Dehalococcoidia bacterium]|nr:hypothetical protein [Dehalococcoidia bacterium]